jgi:hypothetical protein
MKIKEAKPNDYCTFTKDGKSVGLLVVEVRLNYDERYIPVVCLKNESGMEHFDKGTLYFVDGEMMVEIG